MVCDCYTSGWRCDNPCLSDALVQDSLFYNIGVVSPLFFHLFLCRGGMTDPRRVL